jgi:hypothetical protein
MTFMKNTTRLTQLFLVAILLIPFFAGAAEPSKGTLKTYLLMGQSNMGGAGDYSKLDQAWAKGLEQNERVHFCSEETGWEVSRLTHSTRTGGKYKLTGSFGPEYSFIDEVRRAQRELASEMDGISFIPSSTAENPTDFPKHDYVHYNGEGLLNIGKVLAEKALE